MTTLLVANDGGHLRQLHSLAPRLQHDGVAEVEAIDEHLLATAASKTATQVRRPRSS